MMAAALQKQRDGFLITPEDHPNIGVRQKRRSSVSRNAGHESQDEHENATLRPQGIATPPSTPHRNKKRVRFSEPNPTTTGLTPFLGRSSLSSPPPSRSRRHSTPSSRWNLAVDDTPILCGTLQFSPLRQALDGKTKRRIRRNRLSEETNAIEAEKKCERKARVAVELLREQLRKKDLEIREMRNERDLASQIGIEAGVESLTTSHMDEKVKRQELEIIKLRAELQNHERDPSIYDEPIWASGSGGDLNRQLDDDDEFLPDYDEDFNVEMTDILLSTPARRSFPSPPTTLPNTPSKPSSIQEGNLGTPAAESERTQLESQIKVLQEEFKALSKTLELTKTTHERLTSKLAPFIPESTQYEDPASLDAAIDAVLTQLALSESAILESSSRFSALSSELSDLFSSPQFSDPEAILQSLRDQFRAARLELEYLAPGENTAGFENSKLLDMLVSRLRILTQKVQQQDADIDQYHSQEISLRQQLGSRVDAMAQLQQMLDTTTSEVTRLESDIHEREESISKLTHALQGYRDEVAGLENFINRVEVEHAADKAILRDEIESTKRDADTKILDLDLKRETLQAAAEGREMLMRELERRLSGAVASARALEDEYAALHIENATLRDAAADREMVHDEALALCDSKATELNEENKFLRDTSLQREKEHGDALALRDARVAELREEIDMNNAALKRAHDRIMELQRENWHLKAQVDEGKRNNQDVMSFASEILRRMEDGNGDKIEAIAVQDTSSSTYNTDCNPATSGVTSRTVVNPGPGLLFNAGLARRRSTSVGSGKKRRRYDSGLGFLEEEDELL